MHTSTLLTSNDFAFQNPQGNPCAFASVFPDYHPLDRVGVVSPAVDDGIRGCGAALLSLVTTFYDQLRARGGDYFDYPQHFCFLDWNEQGVVAGSGRRAFANGRDGASWGWLDVWPACKWIRGGSTPAQMTDALFNHQINRIFWPAGFFDAAPTEKLGEHVPKMLRSSVKSVHLYGSRQAAVHVSGSVAVRETVSQSLRYLEMDTRDDAVDLLESVSVSQWLTRITG